MSFSFSFIIAIKTTISDQIRQSESVFGGCHCGWRAENEIRECVERIEWSKDLYWDKVKGGSLV